MRNLLKKLFLSVLLQCMFVFCYLQAVLMNKFYMWINPWILWLFFVILNILVQRIVYKIYKNKPLENEKHKNIYLWINGLFIIFEVRLLIGF